MAICLAVISLSMLVSGGLGLHAAKKERRKGDAEIQSLRNSIDEYREISALLMDRESYEKLNAALKDQQKKYESDTARHRADLANYSATNGGLEMGAKALGQAEAALAAGRTQYEVGKRSLEKMNQAMKQAFALYADYLDLVTAIPEILGSTGSILTSLSEYQEKLKVSEDLIDTLTEDLAGLEEIADQGEASNDSVDHSFGPENDQNGEDGEDGTDGNSASGSDQDQDGENSASGNDVDEDEETGSERPVNNQGEDIEDQGKNDSVENEKENEITEIISADNLEIGDSSALEPEREPSGDDTKKADNDVKNSTDTEEEETEAEKDDNNDSIPSSPKTGEEENTGAISEGEGEKQTSQAYEEEAGDEAYLEQLETVRQDAKAVSQVIGDAETEETLCFLLNQIQEKSINLSKSLLKLNIPDSAIQMVLSSAGVDTSFLTPQLLDALDRVKEQGDNIREVAVQAVEFADSLPVSADVLMEQIKNDADAIQAWDQDELEADDVGKMKNSFVMHRELLRTMSRTVALLDLEEAEKVFEDLNTMTGEMTDQMSQIQSGSSQMDELRKTLNEAEEQIAAGEEALATGEAQLNAARETQKKKAEELDREKQKLDKQEKALIQTGEQAEEQKTLEEREKTIRSALLAREEVHNLTLLGEDLVTASEDWLSEYTRQTENNYRDRFGASLLMIACAIPAFTVVLTSFGTKKNLWVTLIATLLCQACAFSALFLLQRMGRGISLASAITGVIATTELVLLIPAMIPPHPAANAMKSKPGQ